MILCYIFFASLHSFLVRLLGYFSFRKIPRLKCYAFSDLRFKDERAGPQRRELLLTAASRTISIDIAVPISDIRTAVHTTRRKGIAVEIADIAVSVERVGVATNIRTL